jgi:hypothetical protein
MNYTAEQIANYIEENVSLSRNENITIWEGPNGLTYTRGSMEFRDDDHLKIMDFITMDEVLDGDELLDSVEFQMKNKQ